MVNIVVKESTNNQPEMARFSTMVFCITNVTTLNYNYTLPCSRIAAIMHTNIQFTQGLHHNLVTCSQSQ